MKRPDYNAILELRKERFLLVHQNQSLINGAKEYYKTRPVAFIRDWCITYDPRNSGTSTPTSMPFILFKRQVEFVKFLKSCWVDQEDGGVEKCRDVGATWVAAGGFSLWLWLFHEGSSIGWGSRKEQLVDKLGDPDSIFEKIRMSIRGLPNFLKPLGYNEKEHSTYMKIINPENGSTITGEAGDNIGRGGRKTIYFKDESAHYERPEKIEAALGDNTNVQIDISSVNGPATVFQRKIDNGEHWFIDKQPTPGKFRVFIFDWRDHPLKTQEWYDRRRKKAEDEGLLRNFAQEVDRDAAAAVEGTLIHPEWVKSAIDAHIKLGIEVEGQKIASLDVADEGIDQHAFTCRKGILTNFLTSWPVGDVGKATRQGLFFCKDLGARTFQYDSIGVGAGVKSETNRLKEKGVLQEKNLRIVPWNASSGVLYPNARVIKGDKQSPKNKDFYANLKAQGWWQLRLRFERTHKMVHGESTFDIDSLISIDSTLKNLPQVEKELTQPTYTPNGAGKIVVDKKPSGQKSPNNADAIMMNYWPKKVAVVMIG